MSNIIQNLTGTLRILYTKHIDIEKNNPSISPWFLPTELLTFKKILSQFSSMTSVDSKEISMPYIEANLLPISPCLKSSIELPGPLYIYGSYSSSIDIALALNKVQLLPTWGSVLVTSQDAGRGQLGRTWISPPGNLYATLRLPQTPLFSSTAAAIAIGALFAYALESIKIPIFLKWPNDLIVFTNNTWKKIGGILIEERDDILLAGVGINIHSSPKNNALRNGSTLSAACLPLPNSPLSNAERILELWIQLVSNVFFCYTTHLEFKRKNSWRTLAERYLAFKHQYITIKDGVNEGQSYQGILKGLSNDGGLYLFISGKQKKFLSGRIQIEEI